MANSKEFTRLMNRLDDIQEELAQVRIELNQAVINGSIGDVDQKRRVMKE